MKNLPAEAFRRYDESPDDEFYRQPRLVTHIEDETIAAVTQLYREVLPQGGAILDLMSSWVSHLPSEVEYRRVAVLGMNQQELEANERATDVAVQNLNANPRLPYADGEFDAATICVSIQYLTQPDIVLRDVGRVVRPGGFLVITFSNRCFPTKAVYLWQQLSDNDHARLVAGYLREAGNWSDITTLDRTPHPSREPLWAVMGRSTGPVRATN